MTKAWMTISFCLLAFLSYMYGAKPYGTRVYAFNGKPSRTVQVDVTKAWLTFSSCLLAFVFVFGNNIRSIYEARHLLARHYAAACRRANMFSVGYSVMLVATHVTALVGTVLTSCRLRTLQSAVFLFAVHPFDVGDVLLLNDKDW